MKKKLFDVCKYLIPENFKKATENELLYSLRDLGNYLAHTQHRKPVRILIDFTKSDICAGECFIDSIGVYPQNTILDYQSYIQCFDTVLHESFHIFQYHLMHMPKDFIKSDITWQRIVAYNLQYFANPDDFAHYRLNYFELDAYRYTDFFLINIYNQFRREHISLPMLKKYILTERKVFYKEKAFCRKKLLSKDFDSAITTANRFFEECGIYGIAENNELSIDDFDKIKSEVKSSGRYLYSVFGDTLIDVSQEFIDNAEDYFTQTMPHLYAKTKDNASNELSK